jgi:Domain of unknown function (DUF3806)
MNILINRTIAIFLCLFMAVLSSCSTNTSPKKYSELTDKDYKHEIDTVDGDTIYFKTATIANTPQKIDSLNEQQKQFVKYCLLSADSIIRNCLSNKNITNFTTTSLDEIIDKWNEDSLQFHCTKEHFVNCIGVAFGDYLIKTHNMEWKIVTDEYGSDYATTIEKINLINFPLNSVLKAIEQKRVGSLTTISLITKRDIVQLRKE